MHKATKYQQRRHKTNFTWMWNYLMDHPCSICSEPDPIVLEFHHPADNKTFTISSGMWNVGLEKLQTEVAKCVVVCANCHKRLHSSRVENADLYQLLVPQSSRKTRPVPRYPRLPVFKPVAPTSSRIVLPEQAIAAEVAAWMDHKEGTD